MSPLNTNRHRYLVIGPLLSARALLDGALAGERGIAAGDAAAAARLVGSQGITAVILLSHLDNGDDRATLECLLRDSAFADLPVLVIGRPNPLSARVDAIRHGVAGIVDDTATVEEIDAIIGAGPGDDLLDLALNRSPSAAFERSMTMLRGAHFTGTVGVSVGDRVGVVSLVRGEIVGTRFGGHHDEEDALTELLEAADSDALSFEVIEAVDSGPVDAVRGIRVLLIDDDADARRVYGTFLQKAGYEVSLASSPEDGLAQARQMRPDVVVTDLNMPRIDGWRVLAELKNHAETADARHILYSALFEVLTDLERTGVNADAYVKKDGHGRTLLSVVHALGAPRALVRAAVKRGESITASTSDVSLGAVLREVAEGKGWHLVLVDDDWTRAELQIEDGRLAGASATTAAGPLHGVAALGHALALRPARVQVVTLPFASGEDGEDLLALIDELRTGRIAEVQRAHNDRLAADAPLAFSRDRLRVYRHRVSLGVRPALAALSRGRTPRSLMESGAFDPVLIDSLVTDIVRRGVARPVDGTAVPTPPNS